MEPKLQEGYLPTPINPATQSANYATSPTYYYPGGQTQYAQPTGMPSGVTFVHPVQPYHNPEIFGIRDWLPWSITNVFVGWLFVGIIPLIFSLLCRSYKQSNNVSRAKTMGIVALISNILVTLAGIGGWIGLIVSVVLASRKVATIHDCIGSVYC